MKRAKNTNPPRWATRFLRWYCKSEIVEDLEGDLHEYFQRNLEMKTLWRARLIYTIDVFKFLRIYTIRKPKFITLLINWIMLGSYIKTSGRNIVRNRLFSIINIAGLAISLSVGLVLIGVISDVTSYDKFQKNRSNIYRVISKHRFLERESNFMATTSLKAANAIKETFTGVDNVAIFYNDFNGDVTWEDNTISVRSLWANESIFDVFSFKLIKGNPATALKEPFTIVVTEQTARNLFGDEDPIGKVVERGFRDKGPGLLVDDRQQYTVVGVIDDLPDLSHIKFGMLASLSTKDVIAKSDDNESSWDHIWSAWAYVLLKDDQDPNDFQTQLDQLSAREDPTVKNTHITLALQPMNEIMYSENMGNQIGPVVGRSMLWIFSALAFVVILSACFNYTNLSIARSLRRTKEVGIRKVIGALRSQVASQFIVEAVIISLCALVIAVGMFVVLRPYFLGIEPKLQQILQLNPSPQLFLYFVLFAIAVGIAAGLFPALFFSRVNAAQVLKNFSSLLGFKKLTLRKVLIVFQFCISIIFITSTIIIYKQYKHFLAFDLGFNTENILNIELQNNKPNLIKKDLYELPEVKEISQSMLVTSVGNYWGTSMKYHANPLDSGNVWYNTVDENYLPMHEHQLLAGRNFIAKSDSAAESEVIVNEQVLKRFNIADQNPAKAIGEIITLDEKNLVIIGVVKDFHYAKANDRGNENEVIFRYSSQNANLLNLKIVSDDWLATYKKIESIWKKHDPVHPFKAKFYEEQLEDAFAGLSASVKLAGFLGFLAITIASMGLLGMVVFTTETRIKEISIRKVLGATEGTLLFLLSKSFVLLLAISILIALPVTVIFFEQVAFPEIGNAAPLSFTDLIPGVLGILIIALVMIYSQTVKVARTNPAEVLKNE